MKNRLSIIQSQYIILKTNKFDIKKEEFQLFLRKWWWQNFFPQFKKGNSYKINKNKIALKFEDILLSRKTKAVLNQPKIVLPNSTEYSNIIPFYAGWDENSRQFVITNRLLSRKKSMFFGEGQNHFLNSMTIIKYGHHNLNNDPN